MSSTAIVTRQTLTPAVWQMISQIAPAVHASRLFGVNSVDQAASVMLKGFELGLGLTASFEFIQVIQGKPTLSPRGALALVLQSSELESINITETSDLCTVHMKRRSGFEYTARFSMDDAKKAGVIKPDSGWEKYPSNMMRWRAIGFACDVVFPDVIGGMKRADELGAEITAEGDVIEGQWATAQQPIVNPGPTVEQSLKWLLEEYGPEAVMEANEGRVPNTSEEIEKIAYKLAEKVES